MQNLKVKIFWPPNYLFTSFWAPKIINRFIVKGNKAHIEKEFFLFFKNLKKITTKPIFLLLGLMKRVRPVFGLKKILNKLSKLAEGAEVADEDKDTPIPKYLRIPIIMRKVRGLKTGIK